jgi:GH24 family phage-related lysozyme (muramidase)
VNKEVVVQQLKFDEGYSATSFWDNDQWTWGHGTKAPGPNRTISREDAAIALSNRVDLAIMDYKQFFTGTEIDEVRAHALVNMLFNLGQSKFGKFVNLIRSVRTNEWGAAAYAAYKSLWFKQLSKPGLKSIERAERIVWELLTGERG